MKKAISISGILYFTRLSILAVICFSFTNAAKYQKYTTQLFLYDGSTGNQYDPLHYTLTTTSEIIPLTDITGVLKVISVNYPDEIYIEGIFAGKPKVDHSEYNSTIQLDLTISQISGSSQFHKQTNRIWVQSN